MYIPEFSLNIQAPNFESSTEVKLDVLPLKLIEEAQAELRKKGEKLSGIKGEEFDRLIHAKAVEILRHLGDLASRGSNSAKLIKQAEISIREMHKTAENFLNECGCYNEQKQSVRDTLSKTDSKLKSAMLSFAAFISPLGKRERDNPKIEMITLRDGTMVPRPIYISTMIAIKDLAVESPVALYDLLKKCMDSSYQFEISPSGNSEKILQHRLLIDKNQHIHESVRELVLNAIEIDESSIKIIDPKR